jgi:hypothetical protein
MSSIVPNSKVLVSGSSSLGTVPPALIVTKEDVGARNNPQASVSDLRPRHEGTGNGGASSYTNHH